MKFRLVTWTCLGAFLLAPGIPAAQSGEPRPAPGPAIEIRGPMLIGGRALGAGAPVQLSDSEASKAVDGVCAYAVSYEIIQRGEAPSSTPVAAGLRIDGAPVAAPAAIAPAAAKKARFAASVLLRPGAHVVEIVLDERAKGRETETGRIFRAAVNVAGPCGAPSSIAGKPQNVVRKPASPGSGFGRSATSEAVAGSRVLTSVVTTLDAWDGIGWKGLTTSPNFSAAKTIVIDTDRKLLVWWFRWSTTIAGASSAEWQVSHVPFGPGVAHVDGPLSTVPPPGQTADFTIDLAPLRTVKAVKPNPAPKVKLALPPEPEPNPLYGSVPGAPKYLPGPDYVGSPPSLFIRVVPLDAAGNPLAPASDTVQVVFKAVEPPTLQILNSPTVALVGQVAGQADAPNAYCYAVVTKTTVTTTKGAKLNLCAGGGWDPLGDFASSVVNVAGAFGHLGAMVADFAHETWESAKAAIVDAVGTILKGSVGCPGWCHAALEAGLNAGMVALGVPPTMPDFDALVSMGGDYLAQQVAEQLAKASPVPIPQELLEKAAKEAADKFISEAKSKATGEGAPIYVPDPAKQFQPLVLKLRVSNVFNAPVGPITITIKDPSGNYYKPREVRLALLAPKQVLTVPVALDPAVGPHDWIKLLPGPDDLPSQKCGPDPALGAYQPPEDTPAQAAAKAKYLECSKKYSALFTMKTKLSETARKSWVEKYTTQPMQLLMDIAGGMPGKLTAGPPIACQSALSGCAAK